MLHPINRFLSPLAGARLATFLALWLMTGALAAQETPKPAPPKPAGSKSDQETVLTRERARDQYKIAVDVNLVVVHATVVDVKGHFVDGLTPANFKLYEDRVEQKITVFRHEDIPITVGLVVDNSGSMRDKRSRVNAAALTFVDTSNRDDEVFVVNFSDDYYLDLDKDFSSDLGELKEALERIDSRGSTALYDAIRASLDHLRKGTRDKRVLLVITDGEDNASRITFDRLLRLAQQSEASIYGIGLLSEQSRRAAKRSKRALTALAEATGGLAFYPDSVHDVEAICRKIAHDIRNQYTLAYYPSNAAKDGTYRNISIQTIPRPGMGKLFIRTRTGYYASRTGGSSPGQ